MIYINKIIVEDLSGLSDLYEELSGTETDFKKMKTSFEYISSNPDYLLMGARSDDGRLVGSLLAIICHDIIGECRPFMVIENVIVSRRYRGMGTGRKLMKYIEDFARSIDCYYIMFVSSINRKESHKFYETLGYSMDVVQGFKKYL